MFIPGMSLGLTSRFLYKDELARMRKKLQRANKLFLPLDIETSGEETKVRLRWHEHWQARNSSKEAEEEVNVPTRIFRVQQVRATLTVHQPLTLPPLSEKYQTVNTIIRMPRAVRFPPKSFPSPSCLLSHYPHAGDDVGGYGVLGGVVRGSPSMDLFCVCSNQGQRCWKGLMQRPLFFQILSVFLVAQVTLVRQSSERPTVCFIRVKSSHSKVCKQFIPKLVPISAFQS